MPQDDHDHDDSASVQMQMQNVQLPPIFEHFIKELQKDRKKLLREKAFGQSAEQLRNYIGLYMFQRQEEMVRLMAAMIIDAYSLAASNTTEVRRLHAFTVDELNRLGANLRDDDIDLPGVSMDVLNDFQAAFYALGTVLQKKYPDDVETQQSYNKVAETVAEMVEELMSGYDDDDRDDDDDDDRDGDDDDDDRDDDDDDDGATDVDEEELMQAASKADKTSDDDEKKGGGEKPEDDSNG